MALSGPAEGNAQSKKEGVASEARKQLDGRAKEMLAQPSGLGPGWNLVGVGRRSNRQSAEPMQDQLREEIWGKSKCRP